MDKVYCGLESQGLPTVQIQVSGGRLAIFVPVDELISYFPESHGSLKTCVDLFQALDVKQNMPDSFALPSLSAIYMKTGDVAYVPAGFTVFEKAITETNLSVRPGSAGCWVTGS